MAITSKTMYLLTKLSRQKLSLEEHRVLVRLLQNLSNCAIEETIEEAAELGDDDGDF